MVWVPIYLLVGADAPSAVGGKQWRFSLSFGSERGIGMKLLASATQGVCPQATPELGGLAGHDRAGDPWVCRTLSCPCDGDGFPQQPRW